MQRDDVWLWWLFGGKQGKEVKVWVRSAKDDRQMDARFSRLYCKLRWSSESDSYIDMEQNNQVSARSIGNTLMRYDIPPRRTMRPPLLST